MALDLSADETFVLTGFRLEYLYDGERDHHVKRIAVVSSRDRENAWLRVTMEDNDGSRPIAATVHYAAVPSRYIETEGTRDSGQHGVSGGAFSVPREPGAAVLTGFTVNWREDHHFKRLMIDVGGDRVQAAFHDNDTNRWFEVSVYYAILREES